MRNKYTNKALKNGDAHFNTYMRGTTGYISITKSMSIFKFIAILLLTVTALILSFHYLTK